MFPSFYNRTPRDNKDTIKVDVKHQSIKGLDYG
jgi:hypothetical protein